MHAFDPQSPAMPLDDVLLLDPERFHRYAIPHSELHRLKATNDGGRFFVKDAMAAAMDAGSKPGKQVGASKSVKDCRLSARSKVKVRTTNNVGITGGYVPTEDRDVECTHWGRDLSARRTPGSRKSRRAAAKNAR